MSDGRIYLSGDEQEFLMEFLELNDPIKAAEKFALLMVEEKADPTDLKKYLKKIMESFERID